jgi:mutator protein MutT
MDRNSHSTLHHSTTSATQPVEVAAGLVFRGGQLLITKRRQQDHLGGLWEFPGGKRHSGESFEQCLRRELREELGIVVEVKDLLETITHEYSEKTVHLKFFLCDWLCNEPQAVECDDFAWVSFDELEAYAFPAADARLLEKLSCSPELWGR